MSTFLTGVPNQDETDVQKDESGLPQLPDDYEFSVNRGNSHDEETFHELQTLIAGVTQMSQSTLLIQKRREMAKVDTSLSTMKQQYDERMLKCFERQKRFEKKQCDMKAQVEKFQKFIHENNHKRQRADLKEKAEIKQRQEHEKAIKRLVKQLADLEREKDSFQRVLKKLLRYQEFLENLVEGSSDVYDEVSDVLNRHKTLIETKHDLEEMVSSEQQRLEAMRNQLSTLRRDTQKEILVKQGMIHKFQKKLEVLRSTRIMQDMHLDQDVSSQIGRSREMSQVMLAIENLHARCVATRSKKNQKQVRKIDKNQEVIKQMHEALQYISNRVIILQDIKRGYANWKEKRRAELAALGKSTELADDRKRGSSLGAAKVGEKGGKKKAATKKLSSGMSVGSRVDDEDEEGDSDMESQGQDW